MILHRRSLVFVSLLLGMSAPCFAEQFVLFDVTLTETMEDADNSRPSKSHFYVVLSRCQNRGTTTSRPDGSRFSNGGRTEYPGSAEDWSPGLP